MIGTTLIIIISLVAFIWVIAEVQKLKHKLWALFLIGLLLFSYISFTVVIKNNDVDLKSVSGLMQASKLYFFWLGNLFGNVKTMTAHAINLDWKPSEESKDK